MATSRGAGVPWALAAIETLPSRLFPIFSGAGICFCAFLSRLRFPAVRGAQVPDCLVWLGRSVSRLVCTVDSSHRFGETHSNQNRIT